jgi:hypothetical protein
MSKQPDSGADNASTNSEPDASFSTNGTEHESAIATANPEPEAIEGESTDHESTEAPAATDDGGADVTMASSDDTDVVANADSSSGSDASSDSDASDGVVETAATADGETVTATAPATDNAAAPGSDDAAAFLSQLVLAMQTTAGAERNRIAADTDRRRDEHLAAIQSRREAEAQKMRELAADDLRAIDGWAEEERQRIHAERERRATDLDVDLEKSLAEHGAKVDREVEVVEAAISAYRIDVDAFFAVLEHETDPVAIAQHAGRRPVFPALDQVVVAAAPAVDATGDTPSADAVVDPAAEPAPVAVMDSNPGSKLASSFAKWNAPSLIEPAVVASPEPAAGAVDAVEAAATEAPAEAGVTEEEAPVAVAHGASGDGPTTILHAVPSGRPLSWLRRDRDSNDRPNGDR